jgi:hypothetical protein
MKSMSETSMLTLLLRASATVKNKCGDPSLNGYVETQAIAQETPELQNEKEADFVLLDCLSDILVQDTQVLSASYNDATKFTMVVPSSNPDLNLNSDLNSNSELDLNPESFDMDFPPHDSVITSTGRSQMHATVIPNSDDRRENYQVSGLLGEIQEVEGGKSLWNAEEDDPLQNDVL